MSSIFFDFHDRVIVVHAVIACIAVLGTLPAALLVQRSAKIKQIRTKYHTYLNMATGLLIVIVFGLGTAAVAWQGQGTQFTGPNMDLHHDMGLALFLLVSLQVIFGLAMSRVKKYGDGKGLMRWAHIILGGSISILLVVQCWNGFDEWNTMQSTGTFTPDGVRYAFIIVAGVEISVYLYLSLRSLLLGLSDNDGPWAHMVESKVPLTADE